MKTTTTKSLLITLCTLILILIAANFIFFHLIRSSGIQISNYQQESELLQSQVLEFSKYKPEDLKALAESVVAKIIPRGDFVSFIESIEASARSQGVDITVDSVDVVPRGEDENDDKQIMNLRLTTVGTWTQTMRFIAYLEHLPYKIDIGQINLSQIEVSGEKGSGVLWNGAFEVTALKFK